MYACAWLNDTSLSVDRDQYVPSLRVLTMALTGRVARTGCDRSARSDIRSGPATVLLLLRGPTAEVARWGMPLLREVAPVEEEWRGTRADAGRSDLAPAEAVSCTAGGGCSYGDSDARVDAPRAGPPPAYGVSVARNFCSSVVSGTIYEARNITFTTKR